MVFNTPGPSLNLNYKNISSSILFFLKKWKNSELHEKKELERGSLNAAAAAKSLQSCPTLCNPIDSSPPGSPDLTKGQMS